MPELTYQQQYYRKNKAKRIAESTAYQQQNKEQRTKYMREYASANREKFRRDSDQQSKYNDRRRQQYSEDPALRERYRNQAREWARNNREKREEQRLRKYGITPDEYQAKYKSQKGQCAICRYEFTDRKSVHVDHCHESGKFRGLLCSQCNLGIGKFSDDPEKLARAAMYLRKSKNKKADQQS